MVVRALLLAVTLAAAACHHDPRPSAVTDLAPPPLPPSSGTPIGILLDDASALHLRADQVDRLRVIDTELIAREDRLSSRERPSAHDPQAPGPQHRGGKRHARRHPGTATLDPDRAKQERQASEQDAIARALELLDPAQRDSARRLLDERGFTTVAVAPAPAPAIEPDDADHAGDLDDDAPAF